MPQKKGRRDFIPFVRQCAPPMGLFPRECPIGADVQPVCVAVVLRLPDGCYGSTRRPTRPRTAAARPTRDSAGGWLPCGRSGTQFPPRWCNAVPGATFMSPPAAPFLPTKAPRPRGRSAKHGISPRQPGRRRARRRQPRARAAPPVQVLPTCSDAARTTGPRARRARHLPSPISPRTPPPRVRRRRSHRDGHLCPSPLAPSDKGTPAARPVRKVTGLHGRRPGYRRSTPPAPRAGTVEGDLP